MFRYTQDMEDFLKEKYKKLPISELTHAFNKKYNTTKNKNAIHSFLTRKNIKCGRTGYFPKDKKPWNAGTKGIMKANKTSFKKGNLPANHRPLGSERICSKDGFILIKIKEDNPHTGAKTRFRHKHIVLWEKENGPVPEGHVVAFKDSDKMNLDPENFMLITKAELLKLNQKGYKEIDEDLKPSVLLISKLEVKSSSMQKKLKK